VIASAAAQPVLSADSVMRFHQVAPAPVRALLAEFGLGLLVVAANDPIPGSYWGVPEAGVIADRVWVRADTPIHSILHEACHLIVLPKLRRQAVHTDASDSQIEEDATCYLQLLLADRIPGFGRDRAFSDMDAWGYTFRLGSARRWFEEDAEDALAFLQARGLV
jgi:hypothetical protein